MPYGTSSHIGLAKETTFGTPVTATEYIKFVSESLDESIEQVASEVQNGVFDASPQYEGLHTIAGDLSFEVFPNSVGHLLRSAFGAPVTTTVVAGVYSHVFTPTQTNFSSVCALPPYTLEVHRDFAQAFQYTGAVVNELMFNFGTDRKIMGGSASMLAKALALITKTTPSFDTVEPFTWNQATITLNGATKTNVSTIGFGVRNELEARAALDTTRNINRILRNGKRTFPINFTLELEDLTEYNLFKAQNEVALKIELVGGVISGANNYKFTVDVPKFHFNAFPINVSGSGAITAAVDGIAEYDPSSAFGMKVTLLNSKASY